MHSVKIGSNRLEKKSRFSADKPKIRVFTPKIAQKSPEKAPILPFFKNRSLDETRRSLAETHRSLAETRRSFFGYCFINMAYRPLAKLNYELRITNYEFLNYEMRMKGQQISELKIENEKCRDVILWRPGK